jgi:hypothetical protein
MEAFYRPRIWVISPIFDSRFREEESVRGTHKNYIRLFRTNGYQFHMEEVAIELKFFVSIYYLI